MNSLIHADCLSIEGMQSIDDKSIDMILADLPYGTTACKWDVIIPFDALWTAYKRIIKDNGAIVLTASQPFTSQLVMSNPKMFKYTWVWNKIGAGNFMNIKNRPLKTHEDIIIFAKTANFTFNPIRVLRAESSLKRDPIGHKRPPICPKTKPEHIGDSTNWGNVDYTFSINGMKHPIDILKFSRREKNCYKIKHPTKKPVALFEYLIKTYTNEGDLVLDNAAGSMTTAIACINLKRRYICIEKDKDIFDKGKARVTERLNQLELNLTTPQPSPASETPEPERNDDE